MATPKPVRKKMASEGPKQSVAKPTATQSAAAKKKAAVKKSAAEGPKRSVSKPSSTAIAIARGKPKVVEAGVGNIPTTVARAGIALGKKFMGNSAKASKGSEGPKKSAPKSNVRVLSQKESKETHNAAIRAKIEKQMWTIKNAARAEDRQKAIQTARSLRTRLKK